RGGSYGNRGRRNSERPPGSSRLREPERGASGFDQLEPGLVAVVRLLRERLLDHRRQCGQRQNARGLLLEVREDDRRLRRTRERRPAGHAFVQDAAERVEVGTTIELVAADLLGSNVVDRPKRTRAADRGRLLAE